jgi:hypothetical protein
MTMPSVLDVRRSVVDVRPPVVEVSRRVERS